MSKYKEVSLKKPEPPNSQDHNPYDASTLEEEYSDQAWLLTVSLFLSDLCSSFMSGYILEPEQIISTFEGHVEYAKFRKNTPEEIPLLLDAYNLLIWHIENDYHAELLLEDKKKLSALDEQKFNQLVDLLQEAINLLHQQQNPKKNTFLTTIMKLIKLRN